MYLWNFSSPLTVRSVQDHSIRRDQIPGVCIPAYLSPASNTSFLQIILIITQPSISWFSNRPFFFLNSFFADIPPVYENNQQVALQRLIHYFKSALHISGDVFAHHQEHLTVFTVSGSVYRSCCRLFDSAVLHVRFAQSSANSR